MSDNLSALADRITRDLELDSPPVQISYLDSPPQGVAEHPGGVPSVCTFFAQGMERPFYAGVRSHEDCEIGAFVLGIRPEGALGERLGATLAGMQKEGYLRPGEEATVPHNAEAPKFVAYGPLGSLPMAPTGVLLFANPRSAMLAVEAAGASPDPRAVPVHGRPMCSLLPILNQGAPVALSVACTGSRIYTDLGVDKMVVGIRGDQLAGFADKLEKIVRANRWVETEDSARKAKAPNAYRRHRGAKRPPRSP
jgi:uncharacterized protein (DUF169 family)